MCIYLGDLALTPIDYGGVIAVRLPDFAQEFVRIDSGGS